MGQFKPMVKMETTEPSVELKLKKGGKVEKKMQMGGMPMGSVGPARGGMGAAAAPGMPALAARRRAMKAMGAAQSAPVGRAATMMGMKEGGKSDVMQDKAMIKKAFKQHDAQEHKGGKGTMLKLKKGGKYASGGAIPSESISGSPATTIVDTAKPDNSPAKTGGVRNGNAGGFKKGGMMKCATGGAIVSEKTSGSYDTTQMHTAKPDNSPANTGEVKKGNAGGFKKGGMMHGGMSGYATGGVAKSNAGGYRKGGAAKKFAEGGRVQNDGGPEQMKQGRKPQTQPVAINMLSGTYKKGGDVSASKLRAVNKAEFAPTMKAAKKDSNEKYGPSRNFMMAEGGKASKDDSDRFMSDVEYVRENMRMLPDDEVVYSKVRGLGPTLASRRLEKRGVDIPGLVGGRPGGVDAIMEGGKKRGGKVC
jgi:hypothetical protein